MDIPGAGSYTPLTWGPMLESVAKRTITTIEELKQMVGQELGVGSWFEITQERVNQFADATGDHQWIHIDPERAKHGPFGGTIAHGYLTLSLSIVLQHGRDGVDVDIAGKMTVNYGLNRVRFPAPIRVGKRIRARTTLLSVEEVQPRIYQAVNQVTIEIEDEAKPGMVAESVTRTYL